MFVTFEGSRGKDTEFAPEGRGSRCPLPIPREPYGNARVKGTRFTRIGAIAIGACVSLAGVIASVNSWAGSVKPALESGTGEGLSRGEAVQNALIEACGKAFGESIRADFTSRKVSLATRSTETGTSTAMMRELNEVISRKVATSDNTPVLGFEVSDAHPTGNGLWVATVNMRYATYQSTIPTNDRRTLVVRAEGDPAAVSFAQALQQGLVSSRRFNVLERDEDMAFATEEQFIVSGDAKRGERARLGGGEGADYLVLARLNNVRVFQTAPKVNSLTGEVSVKGVLSAEYDVKVMEFTSRRVKWVRTGPLQIEDASGLPPDPSTLISTYGNELALQLGRQITDAIYPMRLMNPAGATASINQGEGVVQIGDLLDIFLLGEKMIDPQSGESLGRSETWVGRAIVQEAKPKFSTIRMTEGSLGLAGGDYLARAVNVEGSARANARAAEGAKVQATRQMTDHFLRMRRP
jgi:hypothetical protein